jgi:hypothetical protein
VWMLPEAGNVHTLQRNLAEIFVNLRFELLVKSVVISVGSSGVMPNTLCTGCVRSVLNITPINHKDSIRIIWPRGILALRTAT